MKADENKIFEIYLAICRQPVIEVVPPMDSDKISLLDYFIDEHRGHLFDVHRSRRVSDDFSRQFAKIIR